MLISKAYKVELQHNASPYSSVVPKCCCSPLNLVAHCNHNIQGTDYLLLADSSVFQLSALHFNLLQLRSTTIWTETPSLPHLHPGLMDLDLFAVHDFEKKKKIEKVSEIVACCSVLFRSFLPAYISSFIFLHCLPHSLPFFLPSSLIFISLTLLRTSHFGHAKRNTEKYLFPLRAIKKLGGLKNAKEYEIHRLSY